MRFIKELKALGLKDKEAAVYVACLELGPSPAQQIARKSRVVRATTYVILEELMKMGLVTEYKEGKKTLFSAEPPRQLTRLLEKEKEVISERQHNLELLLPELQMIMKSGGRPSVRYFDGKEGLHAIRQEIVMYCTSKDIIYNFTPTDHLNAVFAEYEKSHYQQRSAKKIRAKTLFTTRSERYLNQLLSAEDLQYTERRYVPPERFPVASGMTIYKDRIAIGQFTGKLGGVVIESEQMSNMMRALFMLAWETAAKI